MPNNNPGGKNSPVAFDRFTRTIPYGEKKVQGDLQRTVPLAGQDPVASALNAPRAAQRAATRPASRTQGAPTDAEPLPPHPEPVAPPSPGQVWADLTAVPGISPLAFEYARRAGG